MNWNDLKKPQTLRILSLPVDDGGCGWYRVRQPFEMIQRFTPHDCHIVDVGKDSMIDLATLLEKDLIDIIVVRQGGESGIPLLKEKFPNSHAKWVMDIDDNIELISPYSNHYQEYGVQEVQHEGKWLWKDGQSEFDLKKNRGRLERLLNGLRVVDLVTVTTPKLAEYARQYNSNVAVLPNCVNLERWWKLPLKPNKTLRVGWSGGSSHYEDWESIREPLNQLLRKYQFTLVMVGHDWTGLIDHDLRHLVEIQDWVPFKGHSYRMMCMNLDIAIIPLADLPFNAYKSAIKWYEFAAMGVPCVVSNITPYKEEIGEGRALGYTSPALFYASMITLVTSEHNRDDVAQRARDWVEKNRSAKDCTNLWIDAYQKLLD